MENATQTTAGQQTTAAVAEGMTDAQYCDWRGSAVTLRGEPHPLADPGVMTIDQIAVTADRFYATVQRWIYHPRSGFPATRARGAVLRWLIETGRMGRDLKPLGATPARPRVKSWVTAHLREGQ